APPAAVFRAFTNPAALRDWLCDAADADRRPGGRIYLWWNDGYYAAGTYTTLDPAGGLSFTWQGSGEREPGTVTVAFAAQDGATRVAVTHDGLDAASAADLARAWE